MIETEEENDQSGLEGGNNLEHCVSVKSASTAELPLSRDRAVPSHQRQPLRNAISEEVVPIRFPNSVKVNKLVSPIPELVSAAPTGKQLPVDGCEIMLQSQNAVMKEELRSVASTLAANEKDGVPIRAVSRSPSSYVSGMAFDGSFTSDLSQSSRSVSLTDSNPQVNEHESVGGIDDDESEDDSENDGNNSHIYGSENDYPSIMEQRMRNRRRASSTLSCLSNVPYGTDDVKWKPPFKEVSRRRYLRDSLKCIKPFLDSNDCLGKVVYIPVPGPAFKTSNTVRVCSSLGLVKNHFLKGYIVGPTELIELNCKNKNAIAGIVKDIKDDDEDDGNEDDGDNGDDDDEDEDDDDDDDEEEEDDEDDEQQNTA